MSARPHGARRPRTIDVAPFAVAVFVRHCFRNTTQRTERTDLALARGRYADLLQELRP